MKIMLLFNEVVPNLYIFCGTQRKILFSS